MAAGEIRIMKKRLESLGILAALAFAWSKLGLRDAVKEIGVNNDITIGTTVQYIPLGKTSWRDAETGIVTGTLESETPGVVSHYQINNAIYVLVAFVRRA